MQKSETKTMFLKQMEQINAFPFLYGSGRLLWALHFKIAREPFVYITFQVTVSAEQQPPPSLKSLQHQLLDLLFFFFL